MGAGLSANAKQALSNCKKEGKTELNFSGCNIRKVKNFRPLLKLKQLTYLNLEHNQIDELPNSMEKLVFLKHINLKDNCLNEVTKAFLVMSELVKFNVSMNQINFLPSPISSLASLTWLDISFNNIKELPEDFAKLPLKHLNYSGNKLKVIPPVVWKCTTLEELLVHHNSLTSLRPEIKGLAKLQFLDISFNELDELSGVIGSLGALKSLFVNDNRIKIVPAELTQLKGLEVLSAGSNKIESLESLNEGFTNLENLTEFLLSDNQLTDVPPDIGHLPKLKIIDLSKNRLETVPKQIGWLDKSLRKLFLQNNRIKQLPGDLCFLNPALKLDLSGNPLDKDIEFHYKKGTPILLENLRGTVRAYPDHCVAYGDALVTGQAGKGESFKIKAFDKFKNEVKGSKDSFECKMTHIPDDGSQGEEYNCIMKNHKNGEHSAFYNVKKTGLYKTEVTNDGMQILGSPFDTVIDPGPASSETTTAAGKGLINSAAGSTVKFSIITRDRFGNPLTVGGANVEVRIEGGSSPVAQVQDNDDGTYVVSYSLGWADTYHIFISVEGKELPETPITIEAFEA